MPNTALSLLLIVALLMPYGVEGQQPSPKDDGILYSEYFSPKKYKANPQNWAVLQNQDGVMLFGNGDGIMTFDGSRWQLTPMANNNLVRSLALAKNRLYAGGYNEIGYIDYDRQDSTKFISLVDQHKGTQPAFGHVWSILLLDSKVYFSTDKNILVWNGEQLREIEIPFDDKRSFVAVYRNKILVQPSAEGLFTLEGENLEPSLGGEFYKGKRITSILTYNADTDLICTLEDGMFLYDGKKSIPFTSEATEFLKENRLYKAIRLSNGNFALGTLLRGVAVITPGGSLVHLLEKGRGLGDNAVYNLTEDYQGALWVTMSVGISRVELQSPMSWFDERNGLAGAVNDIIRYENNLYAATMLGFYKLQPRSSVTTASSFKKINQITSSVWGMTQRHGSLLLATDQGTVELKNGKYKFLDEYSGAVILASRFDPDIVYVGLADGVVIVRFQNGQWNSMGIVQGAEADVGEMNEDAAGNLWLGTFSEGAVQLEFEDQQGKRNYLTPRVSRFGPSNGLPVGYVQLTTIDNQLLFRVEPHRTLYQFNSKEKIFERFTLKPKLPQYDSTLQFPFTSELEGKLWMVHRKTSRPAFDFLLYRQTSSGYESKEIPFSRVREDVDEVIFAEGNVAWLGGLDGIVRLTYDAYPKRNAKFNVIFDGIKLGSDSILYEGIGNPLTNITLPFNLNTVEFSFAATSYDLHEENEYQYILDGFDDNWSSWTPDVSKSYTRISEGDYAFRVKARNIYGQESPEAVYSFTVSPPWYRHFVAYIVYGLLLAGSMYLVVKVRSRKLMKEKAALERIIQDRTVEISRKNVQLEQQAEELKTQTEQLKEMDKIKSNFFTNISHEFRTPLSLILAPLEKELMETPRKQETEMMYRNARRLQTLINQLLDLSKLESGQMKVFLCRNDLTSFIQILLSSFHALAQSKDIVFEQFIPEKPTDAYFDADKLEIILNNLLSNALKFTPEGGKVLFRMTVFEHEQRCEFIVTDSGPGIPEKEIPKIFDRFYQVDGGVQREFEGSGIGLALTKELVLLLQGDISVDSRVGEGTTFKVALPFSKGDNAIIPAEISYEFIPAKVETNGDASFSLADNGEGKEYTILLAEDNQDLSNYLSGILEKTYQVIVTFNGEEALAAANDAIPDLVLSDMMMPKMDGFTLCEEIRKNEATSHIPFILLTARSSVESRLAGLELGADDYITKPFHVVELQTRIKNLLQQRNNLKKRYQQEFKVAPKDITVTSTDEKFLTKVLEAVEKNLANPAFSVEQLSEEVGMSRKNLHRKLVALVDQSPNEFIRIFRLKTAMQLLEQQSGTVKEVAFGVGFNNLSYFAKCFKEQFGMSPTDVKGVKNVAG